MTDLAVKNRTHRRHRGIGRLCSSEISDGLSTPDSGCLIDGGIGRPADITEKNLAVGAVPPLRRTVPNTATILIRAGSFGIPERIPAQDPPGPSGQPHVLVTQDPQQPGSFSGFGRREQSTTRENPVIAYRGVLLPTSVGRVVIEVGVYCPRSGFSPASIVTSPRRNPLLGCSQPPGWSASAKIRIEILA